jgi:hypothetical protein
MFSASDSLLGRCHAADAVALILKAGREVEIPPAIIFALVNVPGWTA